jgi:hypothetical protein
VILEDEKGILCKKLQKAGLVVEALSSQSIYGSNGALMTFNRRQGSNYPIFLINESQGRGLDFPSSSEIEAEGGIYLIIARLPETYLQFSQFLGRTGRLAN